MCPMKYDGVFFLHIVLLMLYNEFPCEFMCSHYDDVIMSTIAFQIPGVSSVRENFGHAGPRTRINNKIAGPASQLQDSTGGTNVILTNYCQSSRTCKCLIYQSTSSVASLGPRTCKFRGDCVSIVCLTAYSGVDQRKHQSSASLAFVTGIHWWPVVCPHKGPMKRKICHWMTSSCIYPYSLGLFHW